MSDDDLEDIQNVIDLSKRGRASRAKGGVGERELIALAKAHGFTEARRTFGSGRNREGDILGIPGIHVECKRCETVSIWKWMAQAEGDARASDTPVVFFRRSRSEWYACLPADELLAWIKVAQS